MLRLSGSLRFIKFSKKVNLGTERVIWLLIVYNDVVYSRPTWLDKALLFIVVCLLGHG